MRVRRAATNWPSLLVILAPSLSMAQVVGIGGSMVDDGSPLSLWVGHSESENISRTPDGERGSYDSAGAVFHVNREAVRSNLGADGDVEFRSYSAGALEDEEVGRARGYANVHIVPNRFDWNSDASYGQVRTKPFEGVGPGNRERFVVFRTGPAARFALTPRTILQLGGTYSERTYKVSRFYDSQATTYDMGLYRQVSRTTRVGLMAQTSDISYDDETRADYSIDAVRLRYSRELADGGVSVEIGENELSAANTKSSGTMASISWNRALTERSTVFLEAGREILDSGQLFGTTGYDLTEDPTNLVLSSSAIEQNRVGALYSFDRPRFGMQIRLTAFSQSFDLDPGFDNDTATLLIRINRELTPRRSLNFDLSYLDRRFTTVDREDLETTARLLLNQRLGARFAVQLYLERYDRESRDLVEDRLYGVRLIYRAADRQ